MGKVKVTVLPAVLFSMAFCLGAAAAAKEPAVTVGNAELAVVLGTNPTLPEKRATELLAERIKDRSGVSLAKSAGKSKYQLVIGTISTNDRVKVFSVNNKDVTSLNPKYAEQTKKLLRGRFLSHRR